MTNDDEEGEVSRANTVRTPSSRFSSGNRNLRNSGVFLSRSEIQRRLKLRRSQSLDTLSSGRTVERGLAGMGSDPYDDSGRAASMPDGRMINWHSAQQREARALHRAALVAPKLTTASGGTASGDLSSNDNTPTDVRSGLAAITGTTGGMINMGDRLFNGANSSSAIANLESDRSRTVSIYEQQTTPSSGRRT